jgi:circadian clock protein KaiC
VTEPEPAHSLPMTPVGVDGFDLVSGGGVPRGRSTLVVGTSGAGKTTFALQFVAAGFAKFDEPGIVVTFAEDPADLLRNTRTFGWGLEAAHDEGRVRFIDATPDFDDDPAVAGPFDLDALLARIEHEARASGAQRLVMDSLGSLFARFENPNSLRRGLTRLIAAIRELGLTTMLTAERTREYGPVGRFDVEEFVADNVVILRNSLEDEKRRRTIEILKYRGAPHEKGEYPLSIDPRSGIHVIPLSAIDLNRPASGERASLGVPELDEMSGGGIFRDALVLVSGATGSGKSLLASSFIDAGLRAGERGMYLAFEESENQVVRNARSWGFDFESAREDGSLRIYAQYAERMGLEDLLIAVRRALAEFGPSRVAIDSLTALERTSSVRSFREFVSGLSGYLKSEGVAGLYVDATSRLAGGDALSDPHVSTMSDMIIMLRYFEAGAELRRCLTILKMRGSRHSRAIREYTIGDEGIELRGPVPEARTVIGLT